MRFGKKDDWDEGWDTDEFEAPVKASDEKTVSLGTIVLIVAVVGMIALVLGKTMTREGFQFEEVPQPLIGAWACNDPAKSDQWVEFRRENVLMSTSGTGSARYKVVGVNHETIGGIDRYEVAYRDLVGKEHTLDVRVISVEGILRFADDPGAEWRRLD